jgi:gas vesicle protein
MANESCNSGGVFVAFLAGGLIGAGLALLYAPVSGSEARAKIGGVVEDLKKRSEGWTTDMKKKVDSFMEAIIKAAYDAGREAMEKEKAKYAKTE